MDGLNTLDGFIEAHVARGGLRNSNAFVEEPGFASLYVRMGRRYIRGEMHPCVLDIANVEASAPGAGTFSRLVERLLGRGLTLYVESVLNARFAAKLLRMGFSEVPGLQGAPSFYLIPSVGR